MCSVRKTWPARLVATVMTLALVFACTFSAYAHAAGHHHHSPRYAVEDTGTHGAGAAEEAGQPDAGHSCIGHGHIEHGGGDGDSSAAESCDVFCHAHAIAAAAAVIPRPALAAPVIQPAAALHNARPSGLERPPRPSLPA
jgi:hypothetical protein